MPVFLPHLVNGMRPPDTLAFVTNLANYFGVAYVMVPALRFDFLLLEPPLEYAIYLHVFKEVRTQQGRQASNEIQTLVQNTALNTGIVHSYLLATMTLLAVIRRNR